jgi:hypothetical protein
MRKPGKGMLKEKGKHQQSFCQRKHVDLSQWKGSLKLSFKVFGISPQKERNQFKKSNLL